MGFDSLLCQCKTGTVLSTAVTWRICLNSRTKAIQTSAARRRFQLTQVLCNLRQTWKKTSARPNKKWFISDIPFRGPTAKRKTKWVRSRTNTGKSDSVQSNETVFRHTVLLLNPGDGKRSPILHLKRLDNIKHRCKILRQKHIYCDVQAAGQQSTVRRLFTAVAMQRNNGSD
jgi:hypothetical protein